MAISIQEHSKLLASKIVGRFVEDIPVREGFDGFFPRETTPTELVDVEVQRDNDLIAVDVMRFTEGNKNSNNKVTEKKYKPPFYREEYDFNRDEVYMNTIALGVGMDSLNVTAAIAQNAIKNVRKNRAKIERAIRLQQAQVLQTGIVELKNGDSIDYKRKAASIVDLGSSNYWTESGSDPQKDLGDAMKFLRDVGNSAGDTVNVIMRSDAMNALLQNEAVRQLLDNRRIRRGDIDMPQFNEVSGLAYHGQLAADDFTVNLWTYNQKYTDAQGNTQYYLDRENVVVLPDDFEGKTVFGGLPYMRMLQMEGQEVGAPGIQEAEFLLRSYMEEKTLSSTLELTSAPLVIPFTIDKVYTLKVLADA